METIGLDNVPDSKLSPMKLANFNSKYSHSPKNSKNKSAYRSSRERFSTREDFRMETDSEEEDEGTGSIHKDGAYRKVASDNLLLSLLHSSFGSSEPTDVNSVVSLGMMSTQNQLKVKVPGIKPIDLSSHAKKEFKPLYAKKVGSHEKLKPIVMKIDTKRATKRALGVKEQELVTKGNENSFKNIDSCFSEQENKSEEKKNMSVNAVRDELQKNTEGMENEGKMIYEKLEVQWEQSLKDEEVKPRKENEVGCQNLRSQIAEEKSDGEFIVELQKKNEEKFDLENKRLQEGLEKQIAAYEQEIEEIKKRNYGEFEAKKRKLEEEHMAAVQDLEQSYEQTKASKDEHEKSNEEIHLNVSKEIANLELRFTEMKNSIASEEKCCNGLKFEIQNLKEEKTYVLKELSELKGSLTTEEANKEQLEKERNLIQDEIDELQEELEKIENDIDLLRTEKTNLCLDLKNLKCKVNEKPLQSSEIQEKREKARGTADKAAGTTCTVVDKEVVLADVSCQVESAQQTYDYKSTQADLIQNKVQRSSFVQTIQVEKIEQPSQTEPVNASYQITATKEVGKKISSISDSSKFRYKGLESKSDDLADILSNMKSHLEDRLLSMEQHINVLEAKIITQPSPAHMSSESLASDHLLYLQPDDQSMFNNIFFQAEMPYSVMNHRSNVSHNDGTNACLPSSVISSCSCDCGNVCEVFCNLKHSLFQLHDNLQQPVLPYFKENYSMQFSTTSSCNEVLSNYRHKIKALREKKTHVPS